MSGICGVLHLDGAAGETGRIGGMLEALRQRGPDGAHAIGIGPAALGHTLLATTPEALSEKQPFVHHETGHAITADIRLDNREDLLTELPDRQGDDSPGDAELVLRAYLRWGTGCLDRLRGDFAFAIWDPSEETLFCARDQIGMRQLVYHHAPGKLFAFATEPEAMLHDALVPKAINEARIADFLEGFEAIDLTSTFFREIHRLPPAHAMKVGRERMRCWRYWQLEKRPTLHLADDREYAEAFLEVFTASVRSRLRSPDPVGSMLSGGMDSGSITAVAARLLRQQGEPPLKTFSAVGFDSDCVETRTIRAAMGIDHIDPTQVSLADFESFREELEYLTRTAREPFDAHMVLVRAVYLAARRAGIKVMLDGGGGDTTLTADDMVAWHLRRGRIFRAWREAKGLERYWVSGPSAWKQFAPRARRAIVPRSLRRLRQRLATPPAPGTEPARLLDEDFASRIGFPERQRANDAHTAGFSGIKQHDRSRSMLHPFLVVGRERYDRVASSLAIEPRDPFLDLRVLELCMQLPAEQFHRDGWPKIILRRAMRGLLPEAVRWRVGKEHLGGAFIKRLWGERLEHLNLNSMTIMQHYASEDALSRAMNGAMRHSEVDEALTLGYGANWMHAFSDAEDLWRR